MTTWTMHFTYDDLVILRAALVRYENHADNKLAETSMDEPSVRKHWGDKSIMAGNLAERVRACTADRRFA